MVASIAAEALKIRKRPATWVIGLLLMALIILFGYVIIYFVTQVEAEGITAEQLAILRESLLTQHIVPQVLSVLSQLGGPLALILGAMSAGSEYGWATIKTILTQRPARWEILAGKLLMLGATTAIFVVAGFATALIASLAIAQRTNVAVTLPAAQEIARGMGAAWLMLTAWTSLGLALAILFRGTSGAIGLGLVYALVVESIISGLAGRSDVLKTLYQGLLGPHTLALARSFEPAGDQAGAMISPERAALTLVCYIVACTLVALSLIQRRDVH
ncbi:MAG: hypothetical protein KatS3mg057_0132 [Herpetosiphonaceae bacterium]|nr:MAG: hypothetical protein KatS3mg057_0132 [Herpetosiphonaceae bacterium]